MISTKAILILVYIREMKPKVLYRVLRTVPTTTIRKSRYLTDMSYLRLKNVTVGYTLPKEWTRKAFIEKGAHLL